MLQKTGGFDVMRGYPREWAKLYPEHEFHLFGAPGGGQNNQEAAIRTCLKQNIDIVFLQFTTQRQLFPVDLESGGINDTWALRKQEDNFFHYAQRFHSFSVKNYVMERKCVMVGPHWPKDKQMPIKGLDWKYREGTGPILNLLKDNGYFNEMAGSWYSIRSFGKRLFPKGFFTILWVPTYEYGPTDKNDSSVVIDGVKVPEFMQDFLTGHNVSKYTDYPSTVYDWMIQNYQDDLNIDSCLLYTSPSPRDQRGSRMPASA